MTKKLKTQKEIQKKHVLSENFRKHQMRSAYSDMPRKSVHIKDGITEQSHVVDCNVNNILNTYMETGTLPTIDPNAQYGDVSDFDYFSLQNQIAQAHSLFEELPENIRSKFNNQPHEFLKFVQEEKNLPELVEMGLANAPLPADENAGLNPAKVDESPQDDPASEEADGVVT